MVSGCRLDHSNGQDAVPLTVSHGRPPAPAAIAGTGVVFGPEYPDVALVVSPMHPWRAIS
jgi:hypothetical protein